MSRISSPRHPLRVQKLLIPRRSFVIRATEASQDPINALHRNGIDASEEFIGAMLPYSAAPRLGQTTIMLTNDAADTVPFEEMHQLLPKPYTSELWMISEMAALQRKRKNRPFLTDFPNHFFIGDKVVVLELDGVERFKPSALPRAGYRFPAMSRMFHPSRP